MEISHKNKSEKIQIIVALVLMALIIIPFLVLAQYSFPKSDDFVMVSRTMNYLEQNDSYLDAALQYFGDNYVKWQGTYTSNIFTAINFPYLIGLDNVKILCTIGIACFFLALFLFVRSFFKGLFHEHRWSITLWFYTAAIFLCTQFVTPSEVFYWYVGSFAYTYSIIFMLLGFTFLIHAYRSINKNSILFSILSGLMLFLACGGPLLFVTFIFIVMLFLTFKAFIKKTDHRLMILILLLVCVVGGVINGIAPGNEIRANSMSWRGDITPAKALALSITGTLNLFSAGDGYPLAIALACCLLLIIPAQKFIKNTNVKFDHPVLVIAFGFISLVAAYFPTIMAEGGTGLTPRYRFTLFLLATGILLYSTIQIAGWLIHRYHLSFDSIGKRLCLTGLSVVMFVTGVQTFTINSWVGMDIINATARGRIQGYSEEIKRVFWLLESSDERDLRINPIGIVYDKLGTIGLSENPDSFANKAATVVYGKDSIAFIPLEEIETTD